MLIDARGLSCPTPLMMAEEALKGMKEGSVVVLVDNEGAVQNLSWLAQRNNFSSESEQDGKDWRVKIVKGHVCAPESGSEAVQATEKTLLLVVGTDSMGREEALGKILMKAFFETMKVTKEIPHTIFFLNSGVKLTTTDADIFPLIKDLETMGVEIYSCGTCLKHYGIEDKLKAGHRGTTNHIVEGMKDFDKTVWIG